MSTVHTISAAEAAYLLHAKLGSLRNWGDFLADAIRDRASIDGLTLLPCCRMHDGRALRPRYDAHAVLNFINEVKARHPEAGRTKITPLMLDVPPSPLWRVNKFDRDGKPMASAPGSHTATCHRVATSLHH